MINIITLLLAYAGLLLSIVSSSPASDPLRLPTRVKNNVIQIQGFPVKVPVHPTFMPACLACSGQF